MGKITLEKIVVNALIELYQQTKQTNIFYDQLEKYTTEVAKQYIKNRENYTIKMEESDVIPLLNKYQGIIKFNNSNCKKGFIIDRPFIEDESNILRLRNSIYTERLAPKDTSFCNSVVGSYLELKNYTDKEVVKEGLGISGNYYDIIKIEKSYNNQTIKIHQNDNIFYLSKGVNNSISLTVDGYKEENYINKTIYLPKNLLNLEDSSTIFGNYRSYNRINLYNFYNLAAINFIGELDKNRKHSVSIRPQNMNYDKLDTSFKNLQKTNKIFIK